MELVNINGRLPQLDEAIEALLKVRAFISKKVFRVLRAGISR